MIRPGFLTDAERRALRTLARDGLSEARVARRANALVLLNDGWSCTAVAEALLMDDDTIRSWHKIYSEDGLFGLVVFGHSGSQSFLTRDQEAALMVWVRSSLPRSVNEIGAWIARNFALDYSRSGLIALLHRLKISHRKADLVSLKLDPVKQQAFIEDYDQLLNGLAPDETVVFVDAVHPAHQV
jgi:transposase